MKSIYTLLIIVGALLICNAQAEDSSFIPIDTSKFSRGLLVIIEVNNLPVFILNRRLDEIDSLKKLHAESLDPVPKCQDCNPVLRSVSPDYLVIWGFHPVSGCELIYASSTSKDWVGHAVHGKGGFVDKCSGTEYDLTGRKLTGPDTSPDELGVPLHCLHEGILEINKKQTFNQKPEYSQEEQERVSLYALIIFILALLVLNIWAQRGSATNNSRLVRSVGVGIGVTFAFQLMVYIEYGFFEKFLLIAVFMQLLYAMCIGWVVWVGYVILDSRKKKEKLVRPP